MKIPNEGDITNLLKDWPNPETMSKVITLVYEDLRRIAVYYFRAQKKDQTLQPTALLHEVYIRLADHPIMAFKSREHFINCAASMMRQLLAKYARAKSGLKRGGPGSDLTFDEAMVTPNGIDPDSVLLLQQAIEKLKKLDARKARIVELRYYLGFTMEEIAQALDISDRTVRRDWRFIRTWMARECQIQSG